MDVLTIILIVAAALLLAAVAFLAAKLAGTKDRLTEQKAAGEKRIAELQEASEKHLAELQTASDKRIAELHQASEKRISEQQAASEKRIAELQAEYDKRLSEQKELNEKAFSRQLEAVKGQIAAESEKMLKAREEEFSKRARESFGTMSEDFNKNLKDMREAFEANKKTQHDSSAEMRTKLDEAVRHLQQQSESVGAKADKLASALRGQNKMQGVWGETQLHNILLAEGLVEGRDFDREETLRDELGISIHNEDTGHKMRPDFILHYPDNTDIIIDCKVSLNALSDYYSAETDAERKDASGRNLKAVQDQVEGLSKKDYTSYLRPGRKCLDYTVMFVPNVNALVLARAENPHLVADAFRKNVLITSEETLMPFLRLVRSAWVNFEQARNQEKLVAAAGRMIDRVSDFSTAYAAVGKKLQDALESYDAGASKLREGGQSIIKAARDVQALGVKGKKELPPVDEILKIES